MNLILLAVHKQYNPDEIIVGFRIFDKETRQMMDANYESVITQLANGVATIDGIEIDNGKLKGSNGVFDRYTTIVNGRSFGNCPLVITKEFPNNVYEVVNFLGQVTNMSLDNLIKYSESEGIANAKIVTKDGKSYISRISGEFERDKKFTDLEYGSTTRNKLKLLNSNIYSLDDNSYAYSECPIDEQPEQIKIGRGCLGVKVAGFRGNKAKIIVLPNTCTNLGTRCFADMVNLEKIVLAEGTRKIPNMCFEDCTSLVEIDLPNSITEIGGNAFKGCKNLKVIRTGPKKPTVAYGAIPSGVRMMPRR